MLTYITNFVSNCCGAPVDLITTTDGSNARRCRKCKKPCDEILSHLTPEQDKDL